MNEGVPKAEIVQPPPEKIRAHESIETAAETEMREDVARAVGEMRKTRESGGDPLLAAREWKDRWEARIASEPENIRAAFYFHCQIARLYWELGDRTGALDAFEYGLDQFEQNKSPEVADLHERMYHKYLELSGNMTAWVPELTGFLDQVYAEGERNEAVIKKIDEFTTQLEAEFSPDYLNRTRTYLLLKRQSIPDEDIKWFDLPEKRIELFIREELGLWLYEEAPSPVLVPPTHRFGAPTKETQRLSQSPRTQEGSENVEKDLLREKIVVGFRERVGQGDPFKDPEIQGFINRWTDIMKTEADKDLKRKSEIMMQFEMGDMLTEAGDHARALLVFMWLHYELSHEENLRGLLVDVTKRINDTVPFVDPQTVKEITQEIEDRF